MTKPGLMPLRGLVPQTARARLSAGVALLLIGLFVFGLGRLAARAQHHAYDDGVRPPATVHLTKGVQYQLSTPGGVPALRKRGVLTPTNRPTCTRSDATSSAQLVFDGVNDDDRDITTFATFVADATGNFTVKCAGIDAVFIDDADNAAFDYSGLSVLLSSVLLALGVSLAASGAYAFSSERTGYESPADEPASAADTSSN